MHRRQKNCLLNRPHVSWGMQGIEDVFLFCARCVQCAVLSVLEFIGVGMFDQLIFGESISHELIQVRLANVAVHKETGREKK